MMKFSLEIEGDIVKFSYEVGLSKTSAETKLSVSWLVALTKILELAYDAWKKQTDDRMLAVKLSEMSPNKEAK